LSALVDWELAARIARLGAGDGPAAMESAPGLDLEAVGARAESSVLAYTDLRPLAPVPRCEWVGRREWAEINLASMRELLAPVESRLAAAGPVDGRRVVGAVVGRVMAVELGGLLALASRRVLGQYELSLLGGDRPPRLVIVGPNVDAAARHLGGDPADVLEWIAAHEVTHAVHFAATPWLRGHLAGLLSSLLAGAELAPSPADVLRRARELAGSDPRRAIEAIRGSDPLTLLASPDSRATLDSLQATMATVEGYAEHVMDAAVATGRERVAELRARLERRRESRGPFARAIAWLLGLELKMRQYRDGKRFADEVAAAGGIGALNRAWEDAAMLPSQGELRDAGAWMARTGAPAAA
jgi:coenzyme F420 biosynthesis associated uncharacterized protein